MNLRENLPECYKASVNESETITEAQPICWGRDFRRNQWIPGVRALSGRTPIERS
jgi:hypothetical protein